MARPPRRPPPQPRPSQTVVALRPDADEAGVAAADDDGYAAVIEALVDELATALEAGGVLDPQDRAALRGQVELALRQQQGDASAEATPDAARAEWRETVEGLRRSEVLTEDDASALLRQLDGVLTPERDRDVARALEFGRRVREQGQDQALAWLKAQDQAGDDDDDAVAVVHAPPASLATSIVNSRSRRLRGPPRR